jgi:hypothetical protein
LATAAAQQKSPTVGKSPTAPQLQLSSYGSPINGKHGQSKKSGSGVVRDVARNGLKQPIGSLEKK